MEKIHVCLHLLIPKTSQLCEISKNIFGLKNHNICTKRDLDEDRRWPFMFVQQKGIYVIETLSVITIFAQQMKVWKNGKWGGLEQKLERERDVSLIFFITYKVKMPHNTALTGETGKNDI